MTDKISLRYIVEYKTKEVILSSVYDVSVLIMFRAYLGTLEKIFSITKNPLDKNEWFRIVIERDGEVEIDWELTYSEKHKKHILDTDVDED